MTIDKALLRQAWPAGFLAIRGVATVGGWTVLGVEAETETAVGTVVFSAPRRKAGWPVNAIAFAGVNEGHLLFGQPQAWDDPEDRALQLALHRALENGDLLPNVDPEDVATWACLLRDLAEVLGIDAPTNLILYQYWGSWWLSKRIFGPRGTKGVYSLLAPVAASDTDDPALALVLAMIEVRKVRDV
jgi:hypothetical protein